LFDNLGELIVFYFFNNPPKHTPPSPCTDRHIIRPGLAIIVILQPYGTPLVFALMSFHDVHRVRKKDPAAPEII
jgi:hypothetical protein